MTILLIIFPSVFLIVFLLLLTSLLLSCGLSIYTLRIQNSKAANAFGILMLVISFWVFIKIITLFVFNIESRNLLHLLNILLVVLITPILFLVAAYNTNIPSWFKSKHLYILFIIPAFAYILVFISSYQNLLYYDFKIVEKYDIPIHVFKKHISYTIINVYDYILIVGTFAILIKSLSSKNKYFRRQMILFIVGLLIPIFYDVLYQFGISPIKDYNLSQVFLSVGNCFLAWSMFGYRFFKILPVAHNQIIDNMPDIIIITSNDNNIIDINKSGERLFEIKKEKAIGLSFHSVFNAYSELIENYTSTTPYKEISITKNNQPYHYSISKSTIGSDKQSLAKIFLLHDITERINAEKQIKRLSTAIEQSPVIIVITDINGKIEYVNPAFCSITGYTYEEALGNNPRVLKGLTPERTFIELWDTILSGQVWKGEFVNKKKSGEYYYEEAIIAPIKNDKNEVFNFIAIKNDISLRKNAENKIQLQNEELKELNATKDKFFSIIAHDLRSPFNIIVGLSDYLVNNFDESGKEEINAYLKDINKSAKQTYRLLENLLEWSRINRGLLKPSLQNYNLKIIALEMVLLNDENAKSKSITFQNNIKSDIYSYCDIEMTRTVLRNLISNAIKFTPKDGIVNLEAMPNENFIEIQVHDTGVGIPADKMPILFSVEENSSTKGTENESGTGLGLILCKEMIESQGGKIWVESVVGKGSTFKFILPQSQP